MLVCSPPLRVYGVLVWSPPLRVYGVLVCSPPLRDELKEKYEGKLSKVMTGQFYEVFSKVLRVLVGRKVTVPGTYKK